MKPVKAFAVLLKRRSKLVGIGNGSEFQFPIFDYKYDAVEFIRRGVVTEGARIVQVEIREVKKRRKAKR